MMKSDNDTSLHYISDDVSNFLKLCRSLSDTDWYVNYGLTECIPQMNRIDLILSSNECRNNGTPIECLSETLIEMDDKLQAHINISVGNSGDGIFSEYLNRSLNQVRVPAGILLERMGGIRPA